MIERCILEKEFVLGETKHWNLLLWSQKNQRAGVRLVTNIEQLVALSYLL